MSFYHFEKEKSDRVKKFIGNLVHTKGKWAGQPFDLQPWEETIIDNVYGMVDDRGMRQYRICYVEIPKKNGKTEFGSALSLYMLSADGEASPEVYNAAADKSQAGLIYQPAVYMVEHNKTLSQRLNVRQSIKRIINPRNNGFMQVLSSDVKTKHGINPSCVTFDELHAQPNDELWRVLTSGTDYAREQQLIFVFTTAGIYDVNSIWWRIRKKAMQIKEGIIQDDSFFALLYCADSEKDAVDDEEVWKRVNPSLGRIFTIEKIRADYEKVKNDPVELQDFKRYRLCIPIKQIHRWMEMRKWDSCKRPKSLFCIDELKGKKAYGGMDLSSTQDLTALGFVFPFENEPWRILGQAYCPEETILDKSKTDKVHYDLWADKGFITPTPGDYVDYSYVEKDCIQAAELYKLEEVGYDPYAAQTLAGNLSNKHGITMVEIRQGALSLSPAIKAIFKKILQQSIIHDGNPVLRWCVDNVVMKIDANENYRPMKDKSHGRIDLFVAIINAMARALVHEIANKKSVYEKRGIRTL